MRNTTQLLKIGIGLVQLIRVGKSILHKWVTNYNVDAVVAQIAPLARFKNLSATFSYVQLVNLF